MLSLEQLRVALADATRDYNNLCFLEARAPPNGRAAVSRTLDFLERKISALRRNILLKARREAQLRARVMQDPYLGRYVRSFQR